jgi:hypothetical protein
MNFVRPPLAMILSVLLLAGLLAGSAAATSCAAPARPRATITGDGERGMNGAFFDHFTAAILGEVVATDSARGMQLGGTKIEIDVYGAIGVSTIGETIVLSADDSGAMNGYPFEQGTSYFVPMQRKGPQGQVNYTFLCDPIGEIAGPAAADELLDLARRNGHPVAVPGNGAEAQQQPGPAAGDSAGPGAAGGTWPATVAWAVAVAAALALAAVVLLRRRRPA